MKKILSLFVVCVLGINLFACSAGCSCSANGSSVNLGSAGSELIDCLKADVGITTDVASSVTGVAMTILGVVAQVVTAGKDGWEGALDQIGVKYGQDALGCATKAVATIFDAAAAPAAGSGSAAPSTAMNSHAAIAARAHAYMAKKGFKFK